MTPCEKKGYKVGDWFIVRNDDVFVKHSIVELCRDDGSSCPLFELIRGMCVEKYKEDTKWYLALSKVIPVPKQETSTVDIVVEDRTVTISRESAIALNLVEE